MFFSIVLSNVFLGGGAPKASCCSFSGAENEPRDIHLSQALPYMEGM